jgi:hypothetical protein
MADDSRKKVKPVAINNIGFNQTHSAWQLNLTFTKLKSKLQSQFGASVVPHTGAWNFSSLQSYDVFIIQTPLNSRPSTAELDALRVYTESGGRLIIIWHSLCEGACTGNPDADTDWPGTQMHDKILQDMGKIQVKSQYPGENNFTSFATILGNTPYVISKVYSYKSAWLHSVSGSAQYIAYAGGFPTAAYNPSVGSGKFYLLGGPYAFHDWFIDMAGYDNVNWLYNIITDCGTAGGGDGGGGGGGGGSANLVITKIKGKPRTLAPGNTMKLIAKVRNKGTADSTADEVDFYLSADKILDASDIYVGSGDVPVLKKNKKTKIVRNSVVPNLPAGDYYVLGKLDSAALEKSSSKTVEIR